MQVTNSPGLGDGVGESIIRRGAFRGDSYTLVDIPETESSFFRETLFLCLCEVDISPQDGPETGAWPFKGLHPPR